MRLLKTLGIIKERKKKKIRFCIQHNMATHKHIFSVSIHEKSDSLFCPLKALDIHRA